MSTYLQPTFTQYIDKGTIRTIFELGSRDIKDAFYMSKFYENSDVYAFECNPDGISECKKNMNYMDEQSKSKIHLIEKAVHIENSKVKFFPFDTTKYDNIGASSMLKIDFSGRPPHEEDLKWSEYPPGFVQREIEVDGTRIDSFCEEKNINSIDLVCIDLQGYELQALKSFGDMISKTKYIITETSYVPTYIGGSNFFELNDFLESKGFKFIVSNKTGNNFPSDSFFSKYTGGTSEFDALFINKSL